MLNTQSTFLVVDDLEVMRQVTASQLHKLGHTNIVTAKNGAEALRVLRKQSVDLVLSDWNMPVMSGLELLKAVRGDEKLSRLPFVMITAEADRGRVAEAIASGVSGLLVKPYTGENLGMRIKMALAPQKCGKLPLGEAAVTMAPVAVSTDPPAQDAAPAK